jgi:hypothetical protein
MQKDLQNAKEAMVKRPRGRPRKLPNNPEPEWTPADQAMLDDLIRRSPVKDELGKAIAARRVVEADRQCRQLDAMIRNPDEQRALGRAQQNCRSWLDRLHVGEVLVDPDDDETDEG